MSNISITFKGYSKRWYYWNMRRYNKKHTNYVATLRVIPIDISLLMRFFNVRNCAQNYVEKSNKFSAFSSFHSERRTNLSSSLSSLVNSPHNERLTTSAISSGKDLRQQIVTNFRLRDRKSNQKIKW